MATIKTTFTFDQATIDRLNQAADRLAKPKSEVVRDAIHDFYERLGKLSERERLHLLQLFDEFVPRIPARPQAEVDDELRSVRLSRRSGGRKSMKEKYP
jgi:lysophospholipase L1-like esterase